MKSKLQSIKLLAYLLLFLFFIGLNSFLFRNDDLSASVERKQKEPQILEQRKDSPDENRFSKVILVEKLGEPMELAVLPDSKVLIVGRKGEIKLYDPTTKAIKLISQIQVNTKYTNGKEAEDGLLGVAIDPGFINNNWIYLYFAPAGTESKNTLARFELRGDQLLLDSKKILLEVETQRDECCHTGGSIAFDSKGNLYLSTGDNTNPFASGGFSPSDERPGRSAWDAQRSSGNTNDLRGKILRIHPEPDGTYTIPNGNLFEKGNPKARAEIYTMGHRNPFRISIDNKNGFLYWGDVGPDANFDSLRGPRGYDEVNQARKAGNFGWPFLIADNKVYNKYDFEHKKLLGSHNPQNLVNSSPNNTGLNSIPPGQKAMMWYPYGTSAEFPLVGSGGRTAMTGPVFYSSDFKNAKRPFPEYYDGKLFIFEWIRGWLMAVTMDSEGNYQAMERIMPAFTFSNPIDMQFGPEGDLYIIEYGSRWFNDNDDSKLIKIEFNEGNRKPLAKVNANRLKGAVPFKVSFSARESIDYDGDSLFYNWGIQKGGKAIKTLSGRNPSFTFSTPGVYQVKLSVTDKKGEKSEAMAEVVAGNEPPSVEIKIVKGNKTFFFPGHSFSYEVKVADKEDGSLSNGKILPGSVAVTADYLEQGFDKIAVAQGHQTAEEIVSLIKGKNLIEGSDCKSCHALDSKSIGPPYSSIKEKYKDKPEKHLTISKKIINGGSGVWGETAMPAHPSIKPGEAEEIVRYIMHLGEKNETKLLPVRGEITFNELPNGTSTYILRASYTDRALNAVPSSTSVSTIILRSPHVLVNEADEFYKMKEVKSGNDSYMVAESPIAYFRMKRLDLTRIEHIKINLHDDMQTKQFSGGRIEIRLNSHEGKLIGSSTLISNRDQGGKSPKSIFINVASTKGLHDLFFIVRNENLVKNTHLLELGDVEFIEGQLDVD